MSRKTLSFFILFFIAGTAFGQQLSRDSLMKLPVYTSLESALQHPDNVYRLHLKWIRMDSLPESVFTLTNLQELSVINCKLLILNHNINKLENLQYLTLYKNRLVRLPNEVCDLHNLRYLDINRNMIDVLPENMGLLTNLQEFNAWGTYLYALPHSISQLENSLQKIDLRQISFRRYEIEAIERQLPKTEILYTNICDCKNGRK